MGFWINIQKNRSKKKVKKNEKNSIDGNAANRYERWFECCRI